MVDRFKIFAKAQETVAFPVPLVGRPSRRAATEAHRTALQPRQAETNVGVSFDYLFSHTPPSTPPRFARRDHRRPPPRPTAN